MYYNIKYIFLISFLVSRSMLEAVWPSWAVNYTSQVVTTTRLSCRMWWRHSTRPHAHGLSLDDYLSRPSGTAASAYSASSCRRCPVHLNPLTYPSQMPSTCTGTSVTKQRFTISTTISTRTRTRMWTQRTEFGPRNILLHFSLFSLVVAVYWLGELQERLSLIAWKTEKFREAAALV